MEKLYLKNLNIMLTLFITELSIMKQETDTWMLSITPKLAP